MNDDEEVLSAAAAEKLAAWQPPGDFVANVMKTRSSLEIDGHVVPPGKARRIFWHRALIALARGFEVYDTRDSKKLGYKRNGKEKRLRRAA